ncbi:MAG: hypothetical protein RH917_04535 [Lacipirellulaceae bacterium]
MLITIAVCCGCGFSIERVKPANENTRDIVRYESPQDCYDAMTIAASQDDFEAALDCMTVETQQQLGGLLLYRGHLNRVAADYAMFRGDKRGEGTQAAITAMNEIFDRYKIDAKVLNNLPPFTAQTLSDTVAMRQLGKRINDIHGFTSAMLSLLAKLNPGKAPLQVLDGELTIDESSEDTAKGTIVSGDATEQVQFRRIEGGWQIVLEVSGLTQQSRPATSKEPSRTPGPDALDNLE